MRTQPCQDTIKLLNVLQRLIDEGTGPKIIWRVLRRLEKDAQR